MESSTYDLQMRYTYARYMFFSLVCVVFDPANYGGEHLFFAVHVKQIAGNQLVHLLLSKIIFFMN